MTDFYRATVQRTSRGEWQWSVGDGGEHRPFASGGSFDRQVALDQAGRALALVPAASAAEREP